MDDQITNEQIDAMLDKHRPDRYDVDDRSWRAPVVKSVAGRLQPKRAQDIAAEKMVSDREGRATRSVNVMLRRVGVDKQWPIPELTHDLDRRPMSIGSERVCLAAAEPRDFANWAIDERRDASQDFSARSAACDGAEWLAAEMVAKGYAVFADSYAGDDTP